MFFITQFVTFKKMLFKIRIFPKQKKKRKTQIFFQKREKREKKKRKLNFLILYIL